MGGKQQQASLWQILAGSPRYQDRGALRQEEPHQGTGRGLGMGGSACPLIIASGSLRRVNCESDTSLGEKQDSLKDKKKRLGLRGHWLALKPRFLADLLQGRHGHQPHC